MAVIQEIQVNNNLTMVLTDDPIYFCEIHETPRSSAMFVRLCYVEYDGNKKGFKDIHINFHLTGFDVTSCIDSILNMLSLAKKIRNDVLKSNVPDLEPIINLVIKQATEENPG